MTDKEIKAFIEKYKVPKHVQRHSERVCEFALAIGEKLKQKGFDIDLDALKAAGLLHDMLRIIDFRKFDPESFADPVSKDDVELWKTLREKYKGLHHADVAADIIKESGYSKIASIVRKHQFLQILKGFDTWEEKILYYADKRTKHGKVVPILDRLEEGQRRNAKETIGSEESKVTFNKVIELEKELVLALGSDSGMLGILSA